MKDYLLNKKITLDDKSEYVVIATSSLNGNFYVIGQEIVSNSLGSSLAVFQFLNNSLVLEEDMNICKQVLNNVII